MIAADIEASTAAIDPLDSLMRGSYMDSESGKRVRLDTRSLVIADSLKGREVELVTDLGLGQRLAVISDPATYAVLGGRTGEALGGKFMVSEIVLGSLPHADEKTVAKVREATDTADALIAVGSGTINDIAKYASALDGKPFAVFGTAPSMTGYTSLTASITVHGHKMTLPAHAAAGVFFDLDVLAAAPPNMIRAGLGDTICRSTAQADWLLSHRLLGTEYRLLPFDLLAEDETQLLEMAADLLAGDLEAMRVLIRTLVLSGLGTAIVGSSAPASQAEHLVSHYIDMLADSSRPMVLHGEQVGVTTLSSARLQQAMLSGPAPVVEAYDVSEADVVAHFGDELSPSIWAEFAAKRLDRERANTLNHKIEMNWDSIRDEIEAVRLPVKRIESVLAAAGAPLTPADIHLDRSFYEAALLHAREIRNRFTFLDLAAASERLVPLLPSL